MDIFSEVLHFYLKKIKVNLQVHNKKVILDQKWTFETCVMNDFWKENDLDGSQGDLRALGHPQRPQQAQPKASAASTSYVHQKFDNPNLKDLRK